MKHKHQVRASHTKADDLIMVELRPMFANPPSAVISLARHGVPEDCFSLCELEAVALAITTLVTQIRAEAAHGTLAAI